jgi:isoquinoline 1-oxidoreductase beta subunit
MALGAHRASCRNCGPRAADFQNGGVVQGTYRDFRVMRMNETPVIETHIATSNRRPDGFKEHPAPPVAPAIANAVFAATGKRIRRLPIRASDLAS